MKYTIKRTKRAIAMVELIFALVIMGIALLSAPMLIQQSIQSSHVALQQESIAAIASHTGILLSKHWDEGDTNLSAGIAPIITLRNEAPFSPFTLEGIDGNVSGRTSTVSGLEVNASALLGQDAGDFDDVDDYNGVDINLTVFNGENAVAGDYIDVDINISTRVTYANDRPVDNFTLPTVSINAGNNIFTNSDLGANDSHIKFVQTTLTTANTSVELNKTIVLRAFSCNLGTYSLGGTQYR